MKEYRDTNLKKLAVTLGLSLLVLATLGILASAGSREKALMLFHLDRELNVITFFSALLLLANGFVLRRLNDARREPTISMRFLSFLFIFMAADECLKIHETSEKLTGIDWQLLYLPLIVMAGIGWIQFAFSISTRARLLWIAGAFAWSSSQLLEAVQWNWGSDVMSNHYLIMMICEEISEMSGSSLFLLALATHSLTIRAEETQQRLSVPRRALALHEYSSQVGDPEKPDCGRPKAVTQLIANHINRRTE